MKKRDAEALRKIVGKRVREILIDLEEDSHGFDIVFDDGTVLEIYDIRCPKADDGCRKKQVVFTDLSGGVHRCKDVSVGGGLGWVLRSSSSNCNGDEK
ncbi:hypothetical protein [Geoglobus sp.]